ncbi:RNA polymerase sigma factor [Pedobacter jeongneungensis]|uniref:RNA polymerase sigma factor n=1 Tax=Pedobacter jeongneungensis TaxID=947309 RepID=UPI00068D03B8|nr:RNA polymerase sigma-70 factor [Pedobacter jeongneungensis]
MFYFYSLMISDYSIYDDSKLTSLLIERDNRAFSEIYSRYWPILYKHAFRMLKEEHESEDVVQEVFTKLWHKAPSLQADISIGAYLYISTRNAILNFFSKNKVHHAYLEDLGHFLEQAQEITDHRIRERILSKLIEAEIEKLPPRMREVFELKRNKNLSYKEIAGVMNISELTVKTQMNKAITTLRNKFGNHLPLFLISL